LLHFLGMSGPRDLVFDSSDNLYAASLNAVIVFAPGATLPTRTLTGPGVDPVALAFDSNGNLYAANWFDTVSEFAPWSSTPTATLTGLNYPRAMAFDF